MPSSTSRSQSTGESPVNDNAPTQGETPSLSQAIDEIVEASGELLASSQRLEQRARQLESKVDGIHCLLERYQKQLRAIEFPRSPRNIRRATDSTDTWRM